MTTRRYLAYKKIVEEIAADTEPFAYEEASDELECRYCRELLHTVKRPGYVGRVPPSLTGHSGSCTWIRCKALMEKE